MVLPALPDLIISGATAPTPSSVGRPIQISWTVTNIGNLEAFGFWTDEIYLSSDNILSTNDIWIGNFDRGNGGALEPGTSLFRSEIIQLPSIPAAGQYTLFFRANPFVDIEESRTDNNLFSIPITINLDGPDMAIAATSAPVTARFGDNIILSWTVRNDGTAAASASWYDDVYLSDDEVFDTRDRELTFSFVANTTPVAVGQSYTRTLVATVPRGLLRQGAYHLIFRSDAGQSQGEISEANNIATLPITLADPNAVLPLVTLSATPKTGTLEDGANPLTYTFVRTGSLTNALSVRVGIGGTAVAGSDYSGISPSAGTTPPSAVVTFAAGSNTARLQITPLTDADPELDESVTLTLLTGQGYTVGTTTPVTSWILNDDQAVESQGNTALLRRSDGRAFVRNGALTQMVSAPLGIQVGNPIDDYKMLAAETIGGINKILWRYKPTRQVQTWTLDANWNFQSASSLITRNTPEGWALETAFQLDLTNDNLIGPPVTPIETQGNTSLLRTREGFAYVQQGTALTAVSSPWGSYPGDANSTWRMLAAETILGSNQILWVYNPTNQLHTWTLNSDWSWASSSPLLDRNSPQAWGLELGFQMDLNNDSITGAPLSAIETVGNASLLSRSDGQAYVQQGNTFSTVTSPWGGNAGTAASQWRMLAAETIAGSNQILWVYNPTNQLHIWGMNSSWGWQTSSPLIDRSSPQTWGLESGFGMDLNGDGRIGPPL
jgi:hypothetical protein